jgi:DNA-binding NarL/FixJ family response regulator
MDSVHETMERIYRLFEKHGPKAAAGVLAPLHPPAPERDRVQPLRHAPEVKARVLQLFAEGKTPKQVAEETKIPPGTIGKWSVGAGFTWRNRGYEEMKDEVWRLFSAGKKPKQVAEETKIPHGTIGKWSTRAGFRWNKRRSAEDGK